MIFPNYIPKTTYDTFSLKQKEKEQYVSEQKLVYLLKKIIKFPR